MKKQIKLRKTRDFGDTISATFDFIRFNFKDLVKIILFFAGPWYLLSILFQALFLYSTDMGLGNQTGFVFWNLLSSLFSFIATIVAVLSVYSYIRLYLESDQDTNSISTGAIKALILKYIGPYIGGGILIALLVVVASLFLILPGIWVGVSLSLTMIALIIENRGITASMTRSWYLIKGYWWGTFGLVVVFGLLQFFIVYALMTPFGIAMGVSTFTIFDPNTLSTVNYSLTILITIIYSFVFLLSQMITTVGIAMRYFSIVESKEGTGLKEQIEEMGEA